MKETILAPDPTDSTRLAVILVLIVVVEEITNKASIFAESRATLFTIHLDLLARVALGADQLHELLSVECVRLGVIVAEATRINLPAARALEGDKRFFFGENKIKESFFRTMCELKTGIVTSREIPMIQSPGAQRKAREKEKVKFH